MHNLSQRSLKNLEGVHPNLVKIIKEGIKESPVDFTVTEGLRTTARQQALYAQGRTKPGTVVTNADGVRNKSNHQAKADGYGHAVDLYPYYNGSVHTEGKEVEQKLREIAAHLKATAKCLGLNLTAGIDWKFVDPPHFELS